MPEPRSAALHPSPVAESLRRIQAMVLRNWYLIRRSWPRLLELCYWPTVQLLIWGFMSQFLQGQAGWVAGTVSVLIAAVLLWEVLVRTQIGMSITFLEELWSRNLGNLFVSPLRPWEWVVSLVVMGLIRVLIGLAPPVLIAALLFDYNLLSLGLPLAGFFANLMMLGVALGLLTSGVILRHGLGAEMLAWMAVFVLAPFSAVYYPVAALPHWLQPVALALPTAHVFEGMRAILNGTGHAWGHLLGAVLLNLLYLGLAALYFLRAFGNARQRGALLQTGE
ncbi:ABC transporter permease [Niveispirillum sp. BGYR6]|uniref:ABC transporter permease n=1 Tax=Niveispirillum sp. BGYR6 TaxID=2971249 RepID=UPI0022B9A738|nr:ABC transporter permease [Niveispirillum sp. BGYR6]